MPHKRLKTSKIKATKILTLLLSILILFACKKEGCTDPIALNYDAKAKSNNKLCVYENLYGGQPILATATIEFVDYNEVYNIQATHFAHYYDDDFESLAEYIGHFQDDDTYQYDSTRIRLDFIHKVTPERKIEMIITIQNNAGGELESGTYYFDGDTSQYSVSVGFYNRRDGNLSLYYIPSEDATNNYTYHGESLIRDGKITLNISEDRKSVSGTWEGTIYGEYDFDNKECNDKAIISNGEFSGKIHYH